MIPVHCIVKHDPPNSYGDCVRACVASLLNLPAEAVPHFYHDNNKDAAQDRIREFLATVGYAPFWVHYPADAPLADILTVMNSNCPNAHYILFGRTETGDHVVVCRNDEIVHDPAWYRVPIIGPTSLDRWGVLVLVKL